MQLVDRIVAPLRRPSGGVQGLAAAAPTIATVVLAIVIAAQLAALVWRALGAGDAELEAEAVDFAPEAPAVDLPAIVNAHLFGVAADSGDPSSAPATSANLALTGTLAGREPEQGWAIIGASGQSARVYATGAALPGGTKLVAVYPDRVILDRNGSRESLMLPRLSGGAGSATAPRVAGRQPSASPDASLADSVRQLLVQNPQAGGDRGRVVGLADRRADGHPLRSRRDRLADVVRVHPADDERRQRRHRRRLADELQPGEPAKLLRG
jgi:general secretion pathway protein C